MSDRIDFLVCCLREKETLLEKLVLLLDEEREHIVDLDVEGLEKKREGKLCLIGQLERCKTVCKKALRDAAEERNLDASVTLSALLEAVPPSRREELSTLRRRLFERTDILNRSNRLNRDLLYGSLGTVNRSLAFINKRLGRGGNTYSNEGHVLSGATGSRLINGEI